MTWQVIFYLKKVINKFLENKVRGLQRELIYVLSDSLANRTGFADDVAIVT
jgi:hypothetical protein